MSYSYERVERQRRTTAGRSYGHSGHRSTFGYWIPLALTVTAATVGIAAWIWSERKDDEEDSSSEERLSGGKPPPGYADMSGGLPAGPGPIGFQGPPPGPMGPQDGGFSGPPQQEFPGPPPQGGFQGPPMQGGFQGPPPGPMPPGGFQRGGEAAQSRSTAVETQEENSTIVSRVTGGAINRIASPSQGYDWATTKLAAGVAAAGALVGGALSSIREGSQDDFEDHERWSQEAETRQNGGKEEDVQMGIKRQGTNQEFYSGSIDVPKTVLQPGRSMKRKSIAVVVSAVELDRDGDSDLGSHASILSHLPGHVNLETTRVFVLIYAPDLSTHHLSPVATRRQSQSMTSSFSNISQTDLHTPAQTPGDFPQESAGGILANVDPNPIDEVSTLYKTLHNQASALVERDTMILPFTSPQGHKHILKSLSPEIVYIQETLCGPDGAVVSDLTGWVKQVVVVIGDEGGHGGLVDTDDEADQHAESKTGGDVWWMKEERVGLGHGTSVVESLKVADDWRRRVGEVD